MPYQNAVIKEAARCCTVSPMSLPRKTVSEVVWNGARIPANTINAQASNHGKCCMLSKSEYPNPCRCPSLRSRCQQVRPRGWLEDTPTGSTSAEKAAAGLSHLSFGGGSQACLGQTIAQRLLYSLLNTLQLHNIGSRCSRYGLESTRNITST